MHEGVSSLVLGPFLEDGNRRSLDSTEPLFQLFELFAGESELIRSGIRLVSGDRFLFPPC